MGEANREETRKKGQGNSQQVGGEIVKTAKEIAGLKRQLAES